MNGNQEIIAIMISAGLIVFLAVVFLVFTAYKAAKKDTKMDAEDAAGYTGT